MENSSPVNTRRKFSPAQRHEFVTLYRQSGLTQVEFAQQHQIKVCTFHQWLHRRKQPSTKCPRPVFKELLFSPQTHTPAWSTEIVMGHEFTIRFGAHVSATFMAELVKGLRGPC